MKKNLVLIALVLCSLQMAYASITNTNQSAIFIRMPSRNATTDIDAVYFNPAGLTHLSDGWHLSLHNQSIFQEKTVINEFPFLNNDTYVGEVDVPIFPNLYIVFKKEKLALSFGFGVNSGGGSADFLSGLPSFEIPIASLPAGLTAMGLPTTMYSADMEFIGSSIFSGLQFNVSYALSDAFSIAAGIRYIIAANKYTGFIENIMINPAHPLANPTAAMIPAVSFFTAAGLPTYAAMVSDKEVEAKQEGTGFTPILSMHVKPVDNLNIGIKYEFNTKLELENVTTTDDTGLFPDGVKSRNDIQAILSFGIEYALMPEFRASFSYNTFFDKNADWDGREETVDSNEYNLGFGIEVDVSPSITLSAGFQRAALSLTDAYQSDLDNDLSSNSYHAGAQLKLSKTLDVDIGFLKAVYTDASKMIPYTNFGTFQETYQRSTWAIAVGFTFHPANNAESGE
ncbi:OmpP1/FadL family transporter [Acidobacteriota bacterium]